MLSTSGSGKRKRPASNAPPPCRNNFPSFIISLLNSNRSCTSSDPANTFSWHEKRRRTARREGVMNSTSLFGFIVLCGELSYGFPKTKTLETLNPGDTFSPLSKPTPHTLEESSLRTAFLTPQQNWPGINNHFPYLFPAKERVASRCTKMLNLEEVLLLPRENSGIEREEDRSFSLINNILTCTRRQQSCPSSLWKENNNISKETSLRKED